MRLCYCPSIQEFCYKMVKAKIPASNDYTRTPTEKGNAGTSFQLIGMPLTASEQQILINFILTLFLATILFQLNQMKCLFLIRQGQDFTCRLLAAIHFQYLNVHFISTFLGKIQKYSQFNNLSLLTNQIELFKCIGPGRFDTIIEGIVTAFKQQTKLKWTTFSSFRGIRTQHQLSQNKREHFKSNRSRNDPPMIGNIKISTFGDYLYGKIQNVCFYIKSVKN